MEKSTNLILNRTKLCSNVFSLIFLVKQYIRKRKEQETLKFTKELIEEMKKIRWANKSKVTKGTSIVLTVSLFMISYFFALDFIVLQIQKLF